MNTTKSSSQPEYPYGYLVAALTLVALLLRIPTMLMGIWLDECITLFECAQPTLHDLMSTLKVLDYTPPLFPILERLCVHTFGIGEITVRMLPLAVGVLLIPALYWLGKTVHSRPVGLITAFFATLSPLANFYAVQARYYSLAIFVSCLASAFYFRLVRRTDLPIVPRVSLYVISMTAFLYTTVLGVVLHSALAVATAILLWRQHVGLAVGEKLPSLRALFVAFSLPPLLFAPWLPVIFFQLLLPKRMAATALYKLPLVFAYSFTMFNPLPPWLGFLLTCIAAVVLTVLLLKRLKGGLSFALAPLKSLSREMIILVCAVFIPCATVGYLTPFWLGYFRYVLPFAPLGWTLLAIGLNYCFCRWRQADATTKFLGLPQLRFSSKYLVPFTLLLLTATDVAYVLIFDLKDHPDLSGFRAMARAVRQGKFDNCAICLSPDITGPILYYYLSDKDIKTHNLFICGFVRWACKYPLPIPDLPSWWQPTKTLGEATARIAKLPAQGYHKLALACSRGVANTERVPTKDRTEQFAKILKEKYAMTNSWTHDGLVEPVEIYLFDLDRAAPDSQLAKVRQQQATEGKLEAH